MKPAHLLVITLASLLAACQPATTPPTAALEPAPPSLATVTQPATGFPASPASPPAPSPAATPLDSPTPPADRRAVFPHPIIVYQRQEPASPRPQQWTIYQTGRILASDGSERQAPAPAVQRLFGLLESPEWGELSSARPATDCADCVVHTLIIYHGENIRQVTLSQDPATPPEALPRILHELEALTSP